MSLVDVDSFEVVTLILPDPSLYSAQRREYYQLNASISFNYLASETLTTLSSNNAVPGQDISGLLYLPVLDPFMQCNDVIYNYVPLNTTTQKNLPTSDSFWTWIAVAPWISSQCAHNFLQAAVNDDLRAFVFYIPDNSTEVPDADDPVWDLKDEGKYKKNSRFPIYAISGSSGNKLINAMAQHSGNLTDVPFGHELANEFPPQAYVRLAGNIGLEGHTTLPNLWVIFIVVISILVFIIGFISTSLHCMQKRRRTILQQRIVRGDVDLEQLGIKKLTVPTNILDRMPLYVYPQMSEKTPELHYITDNQETCAICIEEFIPGESQIRQLPCNHIFHSQCVDNFLRQSSSLCPLCKKTSLPKGFCPPVITNAMVLRERRVRNMRDRIPNDPSVPRYLSPGVWSERVRSTLNRTPNGSSRTSNQTHSHSQHPPMSSFTEEMSGARPASGVEVDSQDNSLWQRAVTKAAAESVRQKLDTPPKWKNAVHKIWTR
jgi:hypothetical protein